MIIMTENEKAPTHVITTFCPYCRLPTKQTTVPKDSFKSFANFIHFLGGLDVVQDIGYFYERNSLDNIPDAKIAGADIEFCNGGTFTFFIDTDRDIMIVSKKEDEE